MSKNVLSKKEKEALATVIAKEVLLELAKTNENKSKIIYSQVEIDKIFYGVYFSDEAIKYIQGFSKKQMIKALFFYYELRRAWPTIIKKELLQGQVKLSKTIVSKVFLASESKQKLILNNTKRLSKILECSYDDWAEIILNPNSNLIVYRIEKIIYATKEKSIEWNSDIKRIVNANENTFNKNFKNLSSIIEKNLSWELLLPYITREDFCLRQEIQYVGNENKTENVECNNMNRDVIFDGGMMSSRIDIDSGSTDKMHSNKGLRCTGNCTACNREECIQDIMRMELL